MNAEEIQAIFFAECEESLAAAEQGLAACKAGTHDDDTVNAVFRAVHSIKGGAGAFGYVALQAYTHTFETLLSDVRDGTVAITAPLVDLMLRALDTLSDHVAAARGIGDCPDDAALQAEMTAAMAANAGAVPTPGPASVAAPEESDGDVDFDTMLDLIAGDLAPAPQPADIRWIARIRPHSGAMRNGSEPLLMLRELHDLGGRCIECDVGAVPALDTIDPGTGYFGWTFSVPADVTEAMVRDIFDFVGEECALAFGEEAAMPALRPPERKAPAVSGAVERDGPAAAPARRRWASRSASNWASWTS